MSGFEKFDERFPSKDIFCSSLTGKDISGEYSEYDPKVLTEQILDQKIQRLSSFVFKNVMFYF